MKRSKPLKRSSLKRKTQLKSTSKLSSTKQLSAKPKKPRSKAEQGASEAWKETVVAGGCEVCPARHEPCDGPVQGHHTVTQAALRKLGLVHLLWDIRVGMGACERAHRRHHSRTQPIERSLLRPDTLAFAEEHGLLHLIERYYPDKSLQGQHPGRSLLS